MPATLKDIARECGLAVSTVSNILNNHATSYASEEVRSRVRRTAERLGYKKDYLSSSLRTRKTHSIGVVLDRIDDFTRQAFLVPFVEAFSSRGYEVALAEHRGDADRALSALRGFGDRVKDAVVLFTDLLGKDGADQERLGAALDPSMKILGIGSSLRGRLPCLDIDRGHAVDRTVELFLKQNRRVLVVYEYDWDMRPRFTHWDDPRVTFWGGVHEPADFTARLDGWKGFDAVFFRTDRIAIPALAALRSRGLRVPEDLSVVGFDNYAFSEHTVPALSTWDIGFHRVGLRSQELCLAWLEGSAPEADHFELFEPDFIARASHTGDMT